MALRTRHNHRNASMARAAGPQLIRAILCAALRADSTQRRKREVSNCSSALYALRDFDASAHDDASLHVPSEARVPLDRQFGRVRGWHWRCGSLVREWQSSGSDGGASLPCHRRAWGWQGSCGSCWCWRCRKTSHAGSAGLENMPGRRGCYARP